MLKRLTVKQFQVFNSILSYTGVKKNGTKKNASIEDVNKALGKQVSKMSIYFHIKALEKKGYVKNLGGKYIPTRDGVSQILQEANRIKGLYKYSKDRTRSGFIGDTGTDKESESTDVQGNSGDSSLELSQDNSTPTEQRILEEMRSSIDDVQVS